MDSLNSLLDQIARLEAQNRVERDPDLRRENKTSIRELHKQYRKAAKYRHPWHGLLSIGVVFLLVFVAAVVALLKFTKTYPWQSTVGICLVVFLVMCLSVLMFLLMTGKIDEDTFKNLLQACIDKFPTLSVGKEAKISDKKEDKPLM